MSEKTVTTLVCDMAHRRDASAIGTITIAYNGSEYRVDACSQHLEGLLDRATRVTSKKTTRKTATRRRKLEKVADAVPVNNTPKVRKTQPGGACPFCGKQLATLQKLRSHETMCIHNPNRKGNRANGRSRDRLTV